MLHLIPAPLHRLGLRFAYHLRKYVRRLFKPRLRGVTLILTDGEGRFLLVRHSYGRDAWAFPGGGCMRGEEPEAAARRELREELGLEPQRLDYLGSLEETISGAPHEAHVFAARADGPARLDRREIVEARYFAGDELPEGLSALTWARIALWRSVANVGGRGDSVHSSES